MTKIGRLSFRYKVIFHKFDGKLAFVKAPHNKLYMISWFLIHSYNFIKIWDVKSWISYIGCGRIVSSSLSHHALLPALHSHFDPPPSPIFLFLGGAIECCHWPCMQVTSMISKMKPGEEKLCCELWLWYQRSSWTMTRKSMQCSRQINPCLFATFLVQYNYFLTHRQIIIAALCVHGPAPPLCSRCRLGFKGKHSIHSSY